MKLQITKAMVLLGALCLADPALAQDVSAAKQSDLGTQILEGCNSELVQYCAKVTPGEGRLLACLYAYGDQCEFALDDAAVRLERPINAIAYVASECRAKLETHCANVEVGERRVAQCLKAHASDLSPVCGPSANPA